MSFAGKVVIVTGASRGIGKATALAMGRAGAKVVVAARSEEASKLLGMPGTIHDTVDEIRKLGGEAIGVRTDVSEEESVENLVRQTIQSFGRIDALVNNAVSAGRPSLIGDTTARRWDLIMRVNLRGPFLTCRAALPHMVEQGGGSIVNVSSPAADFDGPRHIIVDVNIGIEKTHETPGCIAYGASKAGLERFSNALAHEVKPHNVAVNVVKPRVAVLTEGMRNLHPNDDWSRWRKPEDYMVKAIMFLATRDVSLTGQIFYDDEVCERFGL